MIIDKYFSSLRNLSRATMSKNLKKKLYLNVKHKFKKTSCITQAHFDDCRNDIFSDFVMFSRFIVSV